MSTLSIINAAVFDGVSDALTEGPVHVADGRIAAVGGPAQPADRVIDARGGTVLPGLIDAHCHAYGIDLLTALRSATSVNAGLIGRSDLGRVQVGCVADLLVVVGNPVENPSALWSAGQPRTVIQGGTVR
jgi:imidazolonepropionase-like amidohydrolase